MVMMEVKMTRMPKHHRPQPRRRNAHNDGPKDHGPDAPPRIMTMMTRLTVRLRTSQWLALTRYLSACCLTFASNS
jgi:hypothetical protein